MTRIVDKMLRNAFNLGYVQLTLPKACVLHTVRHPLDVALSCFSQPFEGRGLPWAAQLDGVPHCTMTKPLDQTAVMVRVSGVVHACDDYHIASIGANHGDSLCYLRVLQGSADLEMIRMER